MKSVLINQGAFFAVLEDNRLVDFFGNTENAPTTQVGRIYKGRVERVVPGMEAAFVNIGLDKNGFLPLKETPSFQNSAYALPLQVGQDVLVQVKKDEVGTKGVYLTRDIALPGQTVLLMPCNTHIGVSKRIEENETREKLHAIGIACRPENMGLVMRSHALEVKEDEVKAEVEALAATFAAVRKAYVDHGAPCLVYAEENILAEIALKYPMDKFEKRLTCDATLAKTPGWQQYTGENKLFDIYKITDQLNKALQRNVWMKSGASLMIDPCEAMTVIDVNSSKNTGKKLLEETLYQINLEACAEIALQARLRNLSGILIIDFMDMEQEAHRQSVLTALKDAFARDKVKTVIHGFTSLGLVEMTRKRTSPPLRQALARPCGRCHGNGVLLNELEGI